MIGVVQPFAPSSRRPLAAYRGALSLPWQFGIGRLVDDARGRFRAARSVGLLVFQDALRNVFGLGQDTFRFHVAEVEEDLVPLPGHELVKIDEQDAIPVGGGELTQGIIRFVDVGAPREQGHRRVGRAGHRGQHHLRVAQQREVDDGRDVAAEGLQIIGRIGLLPRIRPMRRRVEKRPVGGPKRNRTAR